ncbi:uncharacterized protein LOC110688885 [Chenopodium quinoa]|uniref:uncharacterized protein LOC110688885 n=1 Tax=Chenopodium quinoa TaxID=63459 RepID=UPI000B777E74|nr:uncharacterized protein LOC110688885 [Chenopodium quinoa]
MFRKALTDYFVGSGRNIKFYKNDPNRVGSKCRQHDKGCPWKIWASWDSHKRNFVVKAYIGEHNCGKVAKVTLMSSTWISSNYANWFRVNPYIKLQDIRESIWLDKEIRVSKFMAYRARKKGQALIVGEYEEQYSLLPRYAAEILRSNRGNTVKLQMSGNVFERLYLCFEALKRGFKAGCRPFISLDGCFLKGPFRGRLLFAVGRDGNNQMFPLAWAVVEVESTNTWTWFLSLLGDD